MLARDDLPLGWGLLEVSDTGRVRVTQHSIIFEHEQRKELLILMSVIRRIGVTPGCRGVNIKTYTFKDAFGQDYQSKNRATLGVEDA
jgi:hypothetical protein